MTFSAGVERLKSTGLIPPEARCATMRVLQVPSTSPDHDRLRIKPCYEYGGEAAVQTGASPGTAVDEQTRTTGHQAGRTFDFLGGVCMSGHDHACCFVPLWFAWSGKGLFSRDNLHIHGHM